MRAPSVHWPALLALGTALLGASCVVHAPAQPEVGTAPGPAPAKPSATTTQPGELYQVAVLPLEDDELFRVERAALRRELAGHLARLAPDHIILPLADVDAKLRPLSRWAGNRCAFDGEPAARRAWDEGWTTTNIMHVAGSPGKKSESLWVEIVPRQPAPTITFEAPWNPKLGPVEAYRAAFAALAPLEGGGGLVGGLAGSGSDKDALREGPVTVCEYRSWACDRSGSSDWKDRAGDLAACFAGEDDVTRDVLVQSDAGAPRCEIENLDVTDGREGAREVCLCRVLAASAGMGKRPGRRTIRVHYEAPDLAGKPRPELRVLEVSTNLHASDEWHTSWRQVDGKTQHTSVRRLAVDNLDALAAPLARCAVPAGSVVVADIDVREDGAPTGGKIVSAAPDRESAACVEKALARAAFTCTGDGKPARVRVGVEGRDNGPGGR